MKQDNNFWPSYADLMTSLFFIMMVLYVLTFVKLKHDQNTYKIEAEKFKKIQNIEKSLSYLNQEYFEYDKRNKRYRMKTDMQFKSGSSNINDLSENQKNDLLKAGEELHNLISNLAIENPEVSYVIVLEGNNAHQYLPHLNKWNYEVIEKLGYTISYERALAVYNFWKRKGFDFKKFKNCEILMAGSGYFGKSRDESDEAKNKKFTIQITGNIGEFK